MGRPMVGAAVPAARTGMAVENVEIVEKKLRGATKGSTNATPWAPQVPLRNTGEQVLERPLRGLVGAAGRRGLRPLPWGWGRRLGAAGRRGLRPLPRKGWLGGGRAKQVAKR